MPAKKEGEPGSAAESQVAEMLSSNAPATPLSGNADATLQDIAKRILRSEMAKLGITYRDLAAILEKEGIAETEANVKKKITRGSFSAAYFLRCLRAMGSKTIAVDIPARPNVRYELKEGKKLVAKRGPEPGAPDRSSS